MRVPCRSTQYESPAIARVSRRLSSLLLAVFAPFAADAADFGADEPAYQLGLGYTGEQWRVARGGVERDSRYLDNLDLTFEADLERAFDMPVQVYVHALYNNGHAISPLVGDAQGVSNIEAVDAFRLFEAWTDWRFGADGRHSLRYGLYDVNTEFDVAPSAGLFLGASHGMGREFSQTGEHGPSTFPVTSLAVRYEWRIDDAWTLRAAALDGVPGDPDHPDRTTIRLSSREGALLLTEVSRGGPRLQKLALGVWQYTAKFDDLLAVDSAGQPISRRSNRGAYVIAETALLGPSAAVEEPPRLSAFVRFGVANEDLNRFDRYLGAGLVLRGLIKDDELGIAIAQAYNGDPHRRLARLSGTPEDKVETNLELSWRIPVTQWLAVQPDLQYIFDPGTDPQLRDALVVGVRFEFTAGHAW